MSAAGAIDVGTRPTLRAEALSVALGGRPVVDGVSLELGPGEVVGLLGPNGAGKTTVMRLLVGVLRPDGGRVLLAGDEITDQPVHRRARAGLGYLPQEPSVFAGLTVLRNVEAVLQLRGRPLDQAGDLLQRFGLEHLGARVAATLSGGERRRLELARLLATEPSVVLLDEPFAGLDPLAVEDLGRQIDTLGRSGVGVLLAEHNFRQALTICRRACILGHGRVVAEGSPSEVVDDPHARQVYFGTTSQKLGS